MTDQAGTFATPYGTDADLADLRSRMLTASPTEAADAVMAFDDRRSRLFVMRRCIAKAATCSAEATAILDDPKHSRRPKKLQHGAMLHEEANFYLERALEFVQDELAVMREAYRHALIELGRAHAATGFYAAHSHHLEEALQAHTGIDIRDHMAIRPCGTS